jgi:hypothetical protein
MAGHVEPMAALQQAEAELNAGHFAQARQQLAACSPGSEAEKVQLAALRARLRPDPLAAILIVTCLVVMALAVGLTWR